MTNLEALKSMIEFSYTNDNLFTKLLLDRGITGSATYAATDAENLDLTLADLYLYLAQHPDLSEGKLSIKWNPDALMAARRDLFHKYGTKPPEDTNFKALDGTRIW
jgi:hypothetical protein